MANVVFFIALIAALTTAVVAVVRRRRRPDVRLKRTFARLRANILAGVSSGSRQEAKALLVQSEDYLEGLIRAREQQELIQELMRAGSALIGASGNPADAVVPGSAQMGAVLREHLEVFFAQLSRIAAAVAFQDTEAVDSLREFAEEMEAQRSTLLLLTRELSASSSGARRELSTRTIPSQITDSSTREPSKEEVSEAS